MRHVNGSLLIALLISAQAAAQSTDPAIKTAVVTNERQMTVVFSQDLTNTPTAPQFDNNRVRLLPDNVVPTSVTQNALSRATFTVNFAAVPATATRICFDQVQFVGPDGAAAASSAQVCADLSRDPASIKAEWIAAFQRGPQGIARERSLCQWIRHDRLGRQRGWRRYLPEPRLEHPEPEHVLSTQEDDCRRR